jgi:RND family efflux transporter MFP subunit
MKTTTKSKWSNTKKILIPILIVVLIAAGGFGYFFWTQKTTVAAQSTESSVKTSQVRTGSITISVSGSGTLIAGRSTDLSFSTTGNVAKLNVQVGDQVKQGDVLAQLDNLDDLQADINSAQQTLNTAQQALTTLKQNAAANLANAQIKLADAKKAVEDAKSGVVQKNWVRCDQDTIDAYYSKYTRAQTALEALGDGGGNQDYYLKIILPQKNVVAQAKAVYDYCMKYTDYEVSSSQATLSLAEIELQQAQTNLDDLTKNKGLDPIELGTAENNVSSAQQALQKAKDVLEGATLKAPYDGTILTVAGKQGDSAGTSTFITIADLAHPQIEFSVDETDMDKVAVGETASIAFDAVANKTYKGKVTRIYPALETSNGYQVLKGLIELDLSAEDSKTTLPKGLNATVTLVQASAENVLLVPVQAVHDLGSNTYSVFVMTNGQPKMRVVEIGLQDAASVEIKSGLSAGDVVTTGTVETK